MNKTYIRQASTLFLRVVLIFAGLAVLALCIFALPTIGRSMPLEFPSIANIQYSVLIGYVAAIPFFIALYQAFKILRYIDRNTAFSALSVTALQKIKYCAVVMSVVFASGMPFIYQMAQADDAPGVMVIGMVIVGAPLVVAVFVAVLQRLLQSAIQIKSENDLVV